MWPSAAAGGPLALRGRGGGRAEQGFCASGEVQLGTGRRLLPGQVPPCLAVFGASCDELIRKRTRFRKKPR